MAQEVPSTALERFLLGFEGESLPEELRVLLAGGLAGVVLFPRNFSSVAGLRALTDAIRRAAPRWVLIAIDQEGGKRFSLPAPFTQWPAASELGLLDDPATVERMARALALELAAAGCNVNFAPMLDLHLQPTSPVTLNRSFGSNPRRVAQLGEAFASGLAGGGVLACAKHFPGHGDTQLDPHEDLPVFQGTEQRLSSVELVPFGRVIAKGIPLVMTAHISLPKIDSTRPASLSRTVLDRILREQLGFRGAILADDLGMGAIRKRWSPADASVMTFQAGSDLALLCHDWSAVSPVIEAVEHATNTGMLDERECTESRARIATLRDRIAAAPAAPPIDVIGCAEHRALADTVRRQIQATLRS